MGVLAIIVILTLISFADLSAGRETLSFFTHAPSNFYRDNASVLTIVFFVVTALFSFRLPGLILLLFSQLALTFEWFRAGIVLLSLGIFITIWKHNAVPKEDLQHSYSLFLVIVLVGSIFRLYALNLIPNEFEGELSPYTAGATGNWFMANKGVAGPWAPLGLLYYPPIWLATELFGTTLFSLRISSAWVGILTFIPLFLFAREAFGTRVALIACLLFAFNPLHIGWSRTDVHPHGVTVWPAMLIGFFFLRAYKTDQIHYWILLALSMGLTWHQYPSGQSFVVAPCLALFCLRVLSKRTSWRGELSIAFGVLLWFLGLPVSCYLADGVLEFKNPFTLTTERASWGQKPEVDYVVNKTINNFSDVVKGIFIKVPYLFHQDFLPEYPPLPQTTVPALLVPFFVFGLILLLKRAGSLETVLVISLILAALAPGILSERAYPKRLSVLFPLIDVVGAVGIATLLRGFSFRIIVPVLIVGGLFLSEVTWSSWFVNKWGKSFEEQVVEELSKKIKPGTIIIGRLWESYLEGKLFYLLLDDLRKIPDVAYVRLTREDKYPYNFNDLLQREHNSWTYKWTNLPQYPLQRWKKIIFLMQRGQPWDEELYNKLLTDCQKKEDFEKLVIFECDVIE